MKKVIIVIILFLPSLAFGVTNISSLPFTCSTPRETYVLRKSLSTPGTAIVISANNVILDLNGHTITFGTGNKKSNGIETTWNKNSIEIFGGKIIHGGVGNPPACNGIFIQESSTNVKIHDLEIFVKSRATTVTYEETCGIFMLRAKNPKVYNCVIDNQASEVLNRHSIPAVGIDVQLVAASASCEVYGNDVKTTHMGIRVGGGWGSYGPLGNKVYNNKVTIDQVAVNAYGLLLGDMSQLEAYNNSINGMTKRGGRGIIFSYIENFDIHHNTINTREGRTAESFQTNGIRSRWGVRYGKIRDNIVNVFAGQTADYGNAFGIYVTAAVFSENRMKDIGVEISNNVIKAITYDVNKIACGIYFEIVDKNNQFVIKDNTINTNRLGIKFAASWNEPVNCEDLKLYRTKIIKFAKNSSKFQTYEVTGYRGQVKDVYLVDSTYENGATEDNIFFYQDLPFGELTQVSTTKFVVKDAKGISVPGARVKLTNRLDKQVVYGTTNNKGEYVSEVSYRKYSKSGGRTNFNPFTLTASYDCRVGSKQINVSNLSKEFSVNLSSKKMFPCP
jgi:hypothetical protein